MAGEDLLDRAEPRIHYQEPARETWDCESMLSFTSNLDNYPGSILEPRTPRRRAPRSAAAAATAAAGSGGGIRLSEKTGLPVGYGGGAAAGRSGARGAAAPGTTSAPGGDGSEDEEDAAARPATRRVKGETAEEKKERKSGVKEANVWWTGLSGMEFGGLCGVWGMWTLACLAGEELGIGSF